MVARTRGGLVSLGNEFPARLHPSLANSSQRAASSHSLRAEHGVRRLIVSLRVQYPASETANLERTQ